MIISISSGGKIQYPFMIKNTQQIRNCSELPQPDKGHLQKTHPTSCFIIRCLPSKIRNKIRMPTLATSIQALARAIRQSIYQYK